MHTTALSLPTPDQLRYHVHQVLCARDRLEPAEAPLHAAVLRRAGKLCGMTFAVSGPRLVHVTRVWAAEREVLFYDSTNVRFAGTRLVPAPDARPASSHGDESVSDFLIAPPVLRR